MRRHVSSPAHWAALLILFVSPACGDDSGSDSTLVDDAGIDANPPMEDLAVPEDFFVPEDEGPPDLGLPCDGPPGLYVDPECSVLADDVESYDPRYWLWSDGTDKHRFVSLPEGAAIDTTDPDNWIYPVGTRLWKTFLTADGSTKLETRYFEKLADGAGPDFWDMRTFVWNASQDGVSEVLGGMENVLGTDHDIPSMSECIQCHASPGRIDVINGFSAIQLNHLGSEVSLDSLNRSGRLTTPIDLAAARVPSGGDSRYAAALGYLHANCGMCHGNAGARAGMKLWSRVGVGSFAESNVATTAVGVPGIWAMMGATARIEPGRPDQSSTHIRMSSRDPLVQMPPIGTEVVDEDGLRILRDFILALPLE